MKSNVAVGGVVNTIIAVVPLVMVVIGGGDLGWPSVRSFFLYAILARTVIVVVFVFDNYFTA